MRRLTVDECKMLELEAHDLLKLRRASPTPLVVSAQEKRIGIVLHANDAWAMPRIARTVGVSERTVRTWIARINRVEPGTLTLDAMDDAKRPGRPITYDADHIIRLVRALPAATAVSRDHWTLTSVCQHLDAQHGIAIKRALLGRILQNHGLRLDDPMRDAGRDRAGT